MASATDITVTENEWVDLTTAAGASVGDDLLVQNLKGNFIRVENSTTTPTNFKLGLLVTPFKSAQATTEVGEKVWAFGIGRASTVHVEVL